MAFSKLHQNMNFNLIFTKMSYLDKFIAGCSKSSKSHPVSIFYPVSKVPSKNKKVKFDALIWVRSEVVDDHIPMEAWYTLLETYQNANLGLKNYLPTTSSAGGSTDISDSRDERLTLSENTDSQPNVSLPPANNEVMGSEANAPIDNSDSRCSTAPSENSESRSKTVPVPISASSKEGSSSVESNPKNSSSKFNFKRVGTAPETFIKEKESKNTIRNTATVERLFSKFLKEVHPEDPSDIMTVDESELPNLVAQFFMMLQKNSEENYNESTLKTYFYSLSRLFMEKRKIVLKNNAAFEETRKVLGAQQKVSRENGEIPGKHASRAIPPEVLSTCWNKGVFGKRDPRSLQAAIVLQIQIMFGTRARKELHGMTNSDVVPGPPRPDGLPQYYEFSERLTKTRTGVNGQGARESIPRMYPDDARPERCPIRMFQFFQSKKPAECLKPDSRLFLNALNITVRKWEDCGVWYSSQPSSHNTVGSIVQKQMQLAGVDTKGLKLTGTSIRYVLLSLIFVQMKLLCVLGRPALMVVCQAESQAPMFP